MKRGRIVRSDFSRASLDDVLCVGRNNNLAAIRPLARHVHAGAFEIVYLVKGTQVWGASGRGYLLGGNELFVTQPDEVHSTGIHPVGRSLFYWIQLRAARRGTRLLGLPADESAAVMRRLRSLPGPRLVGVPRLRDLFETLLEPHARRDAFARAILRKAAIDLVLSVIECGGRAAHHDVDDDIRRAVRRADARLGEPITDAALAAEAGLSISRFRTKFREQMGMTAHEYVLRRKVDKAMQLLQDTRRRITRVAYELGFPSSQYFATVFKRFTLRTPREFVRQAREGERPPHV